LVLVLGIIPKNVVGNSSFYGNQINDNNDIPKSLYD